MKKKMKKKSRGWKGLLIFLPLTGLLLSGCVKLSLLVKVEPEGNGTILETMGFPEEVVRLTEEFPGKSSKSRGGKESPELDIFSEENLRTQAGKFGEGVSFKEMKKEVRDGFVYITAEYVFEDIKKIKLNLGEKKAKKRFVSFDFKKLPEGEGELLVHLPPWETEKETPREPRELEKELPPAPEKEKERIEFIKQMFKNTEFSVKIQCGSKILETDATFWEGNTLTLIEFTFAKLLQDMDKFKEIARLTPPPQSPEDFFKALKGLNIKGIKFEVNPQVKVRFK